MIILSSEAGGDGDSAGWDSSSSPVMIRIVVGN